MQQLGLKDYAEASEAPELLPPGYRVTYFYMQARLWERMGDQLSIEQQDAMNPRQRGQWIMYEAVRQAEEARMASSLFL